MKTIMRSRKSVIYLICLFTTLLYRTAEPCSSDFIESRWALPNSMRILIVLTVSSVNLQFYTTDSCIIANVEQMINDEKPTMDTLPDSDDSYYGISIYFLDEGAQRKDNWYTIFGGVNNKITETGSYFLEDSDRKLERFLINISDQSKVLDTLNFQRPLTKFIPDSLFSTSVKDISSNTIFNSQPDYLIPKMVFNLLGRKVTANTKIFSNIYTPSNYILKSENNIHKKIIIQSKSQYNQ